VKRRLAIALSSLLLSGCLVPTEPSKQAEDIASVAAEGALLAHDAAEGDTTATFTRVHSGELRSRLAQLEPEIEVRRLSRLLATTDEALGLLEDNPDDQAHARSAERRLDRAARAARRYAG
jgi:uncharacterized membrane protein YccC